MYDTNAPSSVGYDQMILEALRASEAAVSRAEAEAYMASPSMSYSSFPTSPDLSLGGVEWPDSAFSSCSAKGDAGNEFASPELSNAMLPNFQYPSYQHYSPQVGSPFLDPTPPRASCQDAWLQTQPVMASPAQYPSPPATIQQLSPLPSSFSAFNSPKAGARPPPPDLPLPLQKPTPEALKTYANTDLIGLGFTSRPPAPRRPRKNDTDQTPSVLRTSNSLSQPDYYSDNPRRIVIVTATVIRVCGRIVLYTRVPRLLITSSQGVILHNILRLFLTQQPHFMTNVDIIRQERPATADIKHHRHKEVSDSSI
ncbi:hypothetical protein OIV83_003889 [Microbotryomycetes sp. JL201]|nr:hypothetical protein OIV83_003889 [Microbotryomycetes sp. JL201]